ncbi:MAG: hypothetical protein KF910_09455 [Brevundimonas sp.]|uniref:hypothetical protein n=1 Tax=Brevundimonas sp. TaxID=1871086 RepID=UPI0025C3DB2F|nr:hypothetical protein [Brevundimonas sp.]MBX3477824.1 hypothetical protein [Brevundimonas sp.]
MRRLLTLALVVTAVAGLAACEKRIEAPRERGVCYSVQMPEEGAKTPPQFHVVARDQPQIEFCAARLEEMRQRFLRLGGSNREIIGAYQGQYIFVERRGVAFSQALDGVRFMALARTGDGRLAIPGAIQRDIDAAQAPASAPTK